MEMHKVENNNNNEMASKQRKYFYRNVLPWIDVFMTWQKRPRYSYIQSLYKQTLRVVFMNKRK